MSATTTEQSPLERNVPAQGSLPTLLTIHEVADLLRCSTRTLYRLIDRGEVPRPLRFGALLRWPQTQIETWLAAGCPKAEREPVRV